MDRWRGFRFLVTLALTLTASVVQAEPPSLRTIFSKYGSPAAQPQLRAPSATYGSYPTGDGWIDGYIDNMRRETEYWNQQDELRRMQQSIDDLEHQRRLDSYDD